MANKTPRKVENAMITVEIAVNLSEFIIYIIIETIIIIMHQNYIQKYFYK